eukprot:747822-Hanusia_phi.AAC.3
MCGAPGGTFDVDTLKPARLPPLNIMKGRKEIHGIKQAETRKQEIGTGKSDVWDEGRMSHVSPCSRLSPLLDASKSEGADENSEEIQESPFKVGDVLNKRISILGILGSGAFGTVYIAWDKQTDSYLAVKVQRAGRKHVQVAQDEILLLSAVKRGSETPSRGSDCVVQIVGAFGIPSPHGRQICLALELLGPSLLDLIIDYSYAGCPIPVVASVMRDILSGLDYLHNGCNIVHTDVKPENVLLRLPSSPADWWTENREGGEADGSSSKLRKGWAERLTGPVRAKLVDLGNSCFANRPFTQDIQTIEYRCPEVILGAGFSTSADIWSAACIGFELLTGEYLAFSGREGQLRRGLVREGRRPPGSTSGEEISVFPVALTRTAGAAGDDSSSSGPPWHEIVPLHGRGGQVEENQEPQVLGVGGRAGGEGERPIRAQAVADTMPVRDGPRGGQGSFLLLPPNASFRPAGEEHGSGDAAASLVDQACWERLSGVGNMIGCLEERINMNERELRISPC